MSESAAPVASKPNETRGKPMNRRFWAQTLSLSLSGAIHAFLNIAQSLVVARYYGPGPTLDALAAANSVGRYCAEAQGGQQRAFLQHYVAESKDPGRAEALFLTTQLVFGAAMGLLAWGAWSAAGWLLDRLYPGLEREARTAFQSLMPLVLLVQLFGNSFRLSSAKALAGRRGVLVAALQFAAATATLGATIWLVRKAGLVAVLWARVAVSAVGALALIAALRTVRSSWQRVWQPFLRVLHDGAWLTAAAAIGGAVVVVESRYAAELPEGQLTIVSWARQIVMLASLLLQGGMRQTIAVCVQECVRDDNRVELRHVFRNAIDFGFVCGFVLLAGTFFAGHAVFALTFTGSSWTTPEVQSLWKLTAVYIVTTLPGIVGALLVQLMIARRALLLYLGLETVRLLVYWVCVRYLVELGAYGLGVAQVLQQGVGTALVVVYAYRFLAERPRWSHVGRVLYIVGVLAPLFLMGGAGMFISHWLLRGETSAEVIGRLAITLLFCLPASLFALWGGARRDILILNQFWTRTRRFLRC